MGHGKKYCKFVMVEFFYLSNIHKQTNKKQQKQKIGLCIKKWLSLHELKISANFGNNLKNKVIFYFIICYKYIAMTEKKIPY